MKLTLGRSGLLVASIPGVFPSCPAVDLGGVTVAADYRKRIVDAVLEFRARKEPATTKEEI